jgi:hypothetical protein
MCALRRVGLEDFRSGKQRKDLLARSSAALPTWSHRPSMRGSGPAERHESSFVKFARMNDEDPG